MLIRGIDAVGQVAQSQAMSPFGEIASPAVGGTEGVSAPEFGDILGQLVAQSSAQSASATQTAEAVARGTLDDLHGAMISVKEAEISLKLVGTVRNKLLDAFQEIWRTNV